MNEKIKEYFVEIHDRLPTKQEWIVFRAGFWAGSEWEQETRMQEEDDRDSLDMLNDLIY